MFANIHNERCTIKRYLVRLPQLQVDSNTPTLPETDDPMESSPNPSAARVNQQLHNGICPYQEDDSDCDERWDDPEHLPEGLRADWSPDWYKRSFVPATVRAVLDNPLCTPAHRLLLGNGPAYGWKLPYDYADPLDIRNAEKQVAEHVPLDMFAKVRFLRLRDGPRPKAVPSDCPFRLRQTPNIVRWVNFDKETEEEDWYREQCMLHTRWKDRSEILHGCETHKERYFEHHEVIQRRAQQVTFLGEEEIKAAKEKAKKFLKFEDAENKEAVDRFEQAEMDDEQRAQLGDQLEIYTFAMDDRSRKDLSNGRVPKADTQVVHDDLFMQEAEYRADVRRLHCEQRAVFDHVTLTVKAQLIGTNCYPNASAPKEDVNCEHQIIDFVTGGAGVGKSMLLNVIKQFLMRHYARRISAVSQEAHAEVESGAYHTVLVMSFTGNAAYNVKGSTIHSAMGVESICADPWKCEWTDSNRAKFANKHKHLKFVIFDETSMMDAKMLRFIDLRFRSAFGQNRPFGGLHVLFFGDLFQLPPITKCYVFERMFDGTDSHYESAWVQHVKIFELTIVMRQKDVHFSGILNRLREGKQTPDDYLFFESRKIVRQGEIKDAWSDKLKAIYQKRVPPADLRFICNIHELKDIVNHQDLLNRMTGRVYVSTAQNLLVTEVSDPRSLHALSIRLKIPSEPDDLSEAMTEERKKSQMQLVMQFSVKLGSYVELTTNVDVGDGLYNGASGVVANVTLSHADQPDERIETIWVLFDNPAIGRSLRSLASELMAGEGIDPSWTPILRRGAAFNVMLSISKTMSRVKCVRLQFPLVAAHGKTMHHVQGQTLGTIGIGFLREFKDDGMFYTAVTRPTCEEQLFLDGFKRSWIRVSEKVKAEMARLRCQQNQVVLAVLPVALIATGTNLSYWAHNIRTLSPCEEDVQVSGAAQCDFSILLETHLGAGHGPTFGVLSTHWAVRNDSVFYRGNHPDQPIRGSMLHVNKPLGPILRSYKLSTVNYELTAAFVATPCMVSKTALTIGVYVTCELINIAAVIQGLKDMMTHFADIKTDDTRVVIMGDMNCDEIKAHPRSYKLLVAFMAEHGLHHATKAVRTTHEREGGLDQIWTNTPAAKCVVQACSTYFSDHLPIMLVVHDDPTPRIIDNR